MQQGDSQPFSVQSKPIQEKCQPNQEKDTDTATPQRSNTATLGVGVTPCQATL
jgi:hypothetical protein